MSTADDTTSDDRATDSVDPGAQTGTRRFVPAWWREGALVLGFYFVVAVVAMWPMPIKPLAGYYGFGNDNLGGANIYNWIHDSLFGPGSPGFDPYLQAPFGYDVPLHALQPVDWIYAIVFGGPRGGMVVQNAQVFVGFVLAGAAMYLLVRHLTANKSAALVAGFLFTFSPYHLALGQQYGPLSSIQCIPLYLYTVVRLVEQPTRRHAIHAGLALGFVGLTSFYYLWFGIWFSMLLFVLITVHAAWRRRRDEGRVTIGDARSYGGLVVRRGFAGGLVFLAVFLPFAVPTLRTLSVDDKASVDHPLVEAVRYSGKPIMLVLPPHDNPVLGRFSKDIVYRNLFDMPVYEQSTYLGIVAALLVLVALVPWRIGRSVPVRTRWLLSGGLLIALAMYIGPYLPLTSTYWRDYADPDASAKLPWIGLLMFHLNGTFRFFSRNFVLLSACFTALAGIGAARVFARVPRRAQWSLAAVCIVLAGLEFTNSPPQRFTTATFPTWVREVQQLEPGASVVDYPLAPENSPRSFYYLFWQARHGRATVNPAASNPAKQFAATIANADSASTGRALYDAGIDYAVMHTKLPSGTTPPYQPGWPDDSVSADLGAANPWFEKLTQTDDAVIYRIRPPA